MEAHYTSERVDSSACYEMKSQWNLTDPSEHPEPPALKEYIVSTLFLLLILVFEYLVVASDVEPGPCSSLEHEKVDSGQR